MFDILMIVFSVSFASFCSHANLKEGEKNKIETWKSAFEVPEMERKWQTVAGILFDFFFEYQKQTQREGSKVWSFFRFLSIFFQVPKTDSKRGVQTEDFFQFLSFVPQ